MKKTTLIVVIVLLLIILGGGVSYFLGKSHTSSSQTGEKATTQNQMQPASSGKKSLSDFFSMTGSVKCTFSDKTNNSSGTVYVAVGKMRGDFQSINSGKKTQTHMVNDGSYVYMWTDGQKTGYKMSLASIKSQAGQTANTTNGGEQSSSQGVDMKKQSDYSCGPWVADTSLFSVPTDVTFTDYTTMMQGAMKSVTPPSQQGMTSGQKQNECARCNQVPAGAVRNQCLAAMKCQ